MCVHVQGYGVHVDHTLYTYVLWVENTSESDSCSPEATKTVAKKAQKKNLRLQWDLNP